MRGLVDCFGTQERVPVILNHEESWSVPSNGEELLAGYAGWNPALIRRVKMMSPAATHINSTQSCFQGNRRRGTILRFSRDAEAFGKERAPS
jgi:hypothetical protein